MKHIVGVIATVAALSLLAGGAHAQIGKAKGTAKPGTRDKQDKRFAGMDRMAKELNLTPDQQTKIKAIEKKAQDQVKALRADASLTPEQRGPKLKAIRQEAFKSIGDVLTPEQKTKLKTLREQARAKAKNAKNATGAPAPAKP